MTRALCLRSSKRKPASGSQEVVPEECQQNSPSLLSQNRARKNPSKTCLTISKENISPKGTPSVPAKPSLKEVINFSSPIRKSLRRTKLPLKNQFDTRNVLCDKTNSASNTSVASKEQKCDSINVTSNKNNVLQKLTTAPTFIVSSNNETRVPVYKTVGSLELDTENEVCQPVRKDTVYEFEVDENEEPIQKKKRKKRVYVRKPKLGPKVLTINNIKYSSTESLVSLPEKPATQKKKTTKTSKSYLKPYASVTDLNSSEDTCYSVKSFMSHPPSMMFCDKKRLISKPKLSIVKEIQSEQSESPGSQDINDDPPSIHSSNPLNTINTFSKLNHSSQSQSAPFASTSRCYVSKTCSTTNANININSSNSCQNEINPCENSSSYSPNISRVPHDFLSSTPCRPASLVYHNSVFDDSYDLPEGLRPSTGFVQNNSALLVKPKESCFGFDEPEELEEPLVSPIKNHINIKVNRFANFPRRKLDKSLIDKPKPSAREVIEMLKATLPRSAPKQPSDVFDFSSENVAPLSPAVDNDEEEQVHFKKPPRRSYERQKRVWYRGESEEEEEEKNDEEKKKEVEKPIKKFYRKANKTKFAKAPKTGKMKKAAKEEEEMERLAAQMNAQFQEIEKRSLVVE